MHNTSEIVDLRVAHWSPRNLNPGPGRPGLLVDTCLRQVYIDIQPAAKFFDAGLSGDTAPTEHRSGAEAYRLLLEITTGLHSAIPGETNVFGQFKDAWATFRNHGRQAEVARLAPLMHRLINDTKAIRSEHLHGIGGSSYGSLVRRLIRPCPQDRILFIGAGKLARSMLPLFRHFDVGLWNRSALDNPPANVTRLFRPKQGRVAAFWAHHLILTTPSDPVNDQRWCEWIAATTDRPQIRSLVHLGHGRAQTEAFGAHQIALNSSIETYTLDDVFALRQTQSEHRSAQLDRARAACRSRAFNLIQDERKIGFSCLKTA